MPVFKPDGEWDWMATLTVESQVWLVRRDSGCFNDDDKERSILINGDVVCPKHRNCGYDKVFVIDKCSKHGTWVAGRRVTNEEW